jgi:hypothetical protein
MGYVLRLVDIVAGPLPYMADHAGKRSARVDVRDTSKGLYAQTDTGADERLGWPKA